MTADDFKAWRLRHRMNQVQVATLFRVSVTTVSGWECARFGLDPKVPIICEAWNRMRPEQRKGLFGWCGKAQK